MCSCFFTAVLDEASTCAIVKAGVYNYKNYLFIFQIKSILEKCMLCLDGIY